MFLRYYPKHRVPGYPFKYPTGTRVQKYPKVRALLMPNNLAASHETNEKTWATTAQTHAA